jgi:hypothetical protein
MWNLEQSFPRYMAAVVGDERLQAQVQPAELGPLGSWDFVVGDERLCAPYRIYNPTPRPKALARLEPVQRTVLECVFSRHHDGHVRQAAIRALLHTPEPWVVPFVVRLAGEYVVEISTDICEALEAQTPAAHLDFAAANESFMASMSAKATSYWNCYYRTRFARAEYPGLRALALISPH